MEVEVRIFQVFPPQEGTSQKGTAWKMQNILCETMEQYPKKILFKVSGADRIDRLGISNLKTGDKKRVFFQIDAREYNGKWYNEIVAWDIRDTEQAIKDDPARAI